jgi:hypothetical protein
MGLVWSCFNKNYSLLLNNVTGGFFAKGVLFEGWVLLFFWWSWLCGGEKRLVGAGMGRVGLMLVSI